MKITQQVVEDLIPVYLSGEASPDTVRLVETYLKSHPDLAESVSGQKSCLPEVPGEFTEEAEMRSFQKTKSLLRWKAWTLGGAIFFTLALFSFEVSSRTGFRWLVAGSTPSLLVYGSLAAVSWLAYWRIRRRLA